MAWTELTRAQHKRKTARYPSDLTGEEWAVVCPLLPGRNRLGRPRQVELRRVWDAIQYIAAAGCSWSLLPRDFPPVSTVRYYFYRWRDNGLLAEINRALVGQGLNDAHIHQGHTSHAESLYVGSLPEVLRDHLRLRRRLTRD